MSGSFGQVPELQKFFQAAHGYVHTKGKADRLTTVLIPTGFAVVAGTLLVKGLYGMYTGSGKMD